MCEIHEKQLRQSVLMFSKVINFFDRSNKKSKKIDYFNKRKHYDNNSMDWDDYHEDRESLDRLSWLEKRQYVEKSKSDSSLTALGDSYFRSQDTRVSLDKCNVLWNTTSGFENIDLNNDDNKDEEDDTKFISMKTADDCTCNSYDYGLLRCGLRTQNITTKEIVFQSPEILNFQGNKHFPEEIAPVWKKDCRMWLWKSRKYSNNKNETPKSTDIFSQNF